MTGYDIKLKANGVILLKGNIEHLHSLGDNMTKTYQFAIHNYDYIELEISKGLEDGKEKTKEKTKTQTTLDPFGGGTIDRIEAAGSDTISDSQAQSN